MNTTSENQLINCLVIDDNEADRWAIEKLIGLYPQFRFIASFANPLESLELIPQADLLLLDIDMPLINGLHFLSSLSQPPPCVFITSHPEYALDAFEVNALDFLTKPLKVDRFENALLRAKAYLEIKEKARLYELTVEKDTLLIKEGRQTIRLQVSDILYLEALKDYTKVITHTRDYQTKTEMYMTLMNLKNFMSRLSQQRFVRIHRSYAVALDKITKFNGDEIQVGGIKLPVGQVFKQEVERLFK
jgi:two-component system LytT family response regulator